MTSRADSPTTFPKGVVFHHGTISDQALLGRIFREHKIDTVYHLAAYAAEGLSHFIRAFNYQNNVVGSMNVLNEAIKAEVRCFVFTSSIAVYGANRAPDDRSDGSGAGGPVRDREV